LFLTWSVPEVECVRLPLAHVDRAEVDRRLVELRKRWRGRAGVDALPASGKR